MKLKVKIFPVIVERARTPSLGSARHERGRGAREGGCKGKGPVVKPAWAHTPSHGSARHERGRGAYRVCFRVLGKW